METVELRHYLTLFRKWWWLVLLLALAGGGAAYGVSAYTTPIYRATTTIEIAPGSDPSRDIFSAISSVERVAGTYVAQIGSSVVLDEAAARLAANGIHVDPDDVTAQQVRDTQLIEISAENSSPAAAKAHADMVAQVFIERELNKQRQRFQAGLDEINLQIDEVESAIATARRELAARQVAYASETARLEMAELEVELSSNQQRLSTLLSSAEEFRLAIARYTDYVSIFAPAETPDVPVRPRTLQNTAMAAVVGAMLAVGVVMLVEYLDDTIKTPADAKLHLPVNVLGVLPTYKRTNGHTSPLVVSGEPRHPVAEAFRNLRTSIQFFGVDKPAQTILITSPLPTDGKTFTAANLAVAMAQGGLSVILVDADLHRPKIHKLFELPNRLGLTNALLSAHEPQFALQRTDVPGLRVITSGVQAPNPTEMLSSQRMSRFLGWLNKNADLVILDSPPVLAFADAAVLSNLADGTILVFDSGRTRRPLAAQAVERLSEVGGRILGVVINRLERRSEGYYYDYYHYYDYYSKDAEGKATERGRNGKERPEPIPVREASPEAEE
jgi:capsular exopolysaccharide synthesis family protein